MKNLIFGMFFWVLFLLAVNALQNDSAKKRIAELERRNADIELKIFKLRREVEYITKGIPSVEYSADYIKELFDESY